MKIVKLFEEKQRLLRAFLERTRSFQESLTQDGVEIEAKLDLIDELSDVREANLRVMQALDAEIDQAKKALTPPEVVRLQSDPAFKGVLDGVMTIIREIQLTDQSLFLYIQGTGYELRSQILKSLKEKEAVSKFKSQSQPPTGDGIDQTV
jgi:hypothetical protein